MLKVAYHPVSFLLHLHTHKTGNGNLVYCQDNQELLECMGVKKYLSGEWRLFVDNNKKNLKGVLLSNGQYIKGLNMTQ